MVLPALARRTVQIKACPCRMPVRHWSCGWRLKRRPRNGGTGILIPASILAAKTQFDGGRPWGIRPAVAVVLGGERVTVALLDFFLRGHQRCFTSKPKRSLAARRLNSVSADGSLPMRQSARLT